MNLFETASRDALLQQTFHKVPVHVWHKRTRQVCLRFKYRIERLVQEAVDIIHSRWGESRRRKKAKAILFEYHQSLRKKKRTDESCLDICLRSAVAFLMNWKKPASLAIPA